MVWQLGEQGMASNIKASLAPSTANQYEKMWRKYDEFCFWARCARRSSRTICIFLSYMAETFTGMGGVGGARSALRHHFLVEEPDSICPTDGQEVTLVLKGLNRRFKTQVNKKSALAKVEFYKILVAATKKDKHDVVRLCRLRLAAQVVLMFLSFDTKKAPNSM